ncbi:MAG: amino acid ABC transporter permease [Chloroflexi bacterium]|nr:amino acid ABC transporter permease [Chloroflexota bacterium]
MNTFEFLQIALPEFYEGLLITLQIAGVGLSTGLIVGIPAALGRVYTRGPLRWLAITYIELFRGTPLLVQLFVVYYGLPQVGITLSALTASFLTLGLNSGAYQAEYFRGALQAIGQGQMTAARSLGMTQWEAIRHIIFPQALRVVMPAWSNEAISIVKYTAVVFVIAVPDLLTRAKFLTGRFFNPIQSYLSVAVVYMLIVAVMTLVMNAIEKRMYVPGLSVDSERHGLALASGEH